jgi:chemotaxis protein CheD
MASSTSCATTDHTNVGMGQAVLAAPPARLTMIVGSCIAVAIYAPRRRLGMFTHVVLPHATEATMYPAKFADTAIPYALSALQQQGIHHGDLVARIAGGACMFGDCKTLQIGQFNAQAVLDALTDAAIPVVGQDLGGTVGRRISFDLATGSVIVHRIGQPPQTI